MTLVAYLGFGDGIRPVFVSDIVVSSWQANDGSAVVPLLDEWAPDEHNAISGLRQKVAVVHDDAAVAVAGRLLEGSMLCRRLRECLEAGDAPDERGMGSFVFKSLGQEFYDELTDLSVIASHLQRSPAGIRASHCYFCVPETVHPLNRDSSVFGQVLAYGSGAEDFLAFAGALHIPKFPTPSTTRLYQEIGLSLCAVGRFLSAGDAEIRAHLRDGWGGAFEVTVSMEGGFRKLQDVVYILANIDAASQRSEILPFRLLKLHYIGEHLFVRSVAVKRRNGALFEIMSDRTMHVPPLIFAPSPPVPTITFQRNDWLCFSAVFEDTSKRKASLVAVVPDYEHLSPAATGVFGPLPYAISEPEMGILELKFFDEFLEGIGWGVYAGSHENYDRAVAYIWSTRADQHRENLVRWHLLGASEELSRFLLHGLPIGEAAVMVLELRDAGARDIVIAADEAAHLDADVLILAVSVQDAARLLASHAHAVGALRNALPSGFVRLIVVAAGGVDVYLCSRQPNGLLTTVT